MQEICDQWNKEMKALRWERRLMIIAIVSLAGVRLYGVWFMPLNRSAVDTPNLLHRELRVATTAAQDSITPPSGKRIQVHAAQCSMLVTAALTATLRGSLSFGTGNVSDPDKVLASCRIMKGDDAAAVFMCCITSIGDVDETVTLTNMSFSSGSAITRAVVYYLIV